MLRRNLEKDMAGRHWAATASRSTSSATDNAPEAKSAAAMAIALTTTESIAMPGLSDFDNGGTTANDLQDTRPKPDAERKQKVNRGDDPHGYRKSPDG